MSATSDNARPQEQELWERLRTTEGAEKAEVLDELSHIAYNKNNYIECLQLVDTSIEIYYSLGIDLHTRDLIHVTQGKAFCLVNLKRQREAAEAFESLAQLYQLCDDIAGYIGAIRDAACNWYEVEEWQKCLEGHTAAKDSLDPDATPMSMGIDLLNIGMAHMKLENHEAAIVNFLSARSLFKEAKNPEHVNWCDNYLSRVFIAIKNGPEAKFHAQHYINYSKVAEDFTMEGYARFRLGNAYLLCGEYDEAESELTRSLEMLTLEDSKDWDSIVEANHRLAEALTELGRCEEASERLERLKTIEDTLAA